VFALTVFLRDRLLARSTFDQEEVRIGRSADNEVHLDNLGVSRYHASIATVGEAQVLKDFGSDNGTFVNGERVVGRRALDDGDRITLSKFTLVFRGERRRAEPLAIRDNRQYALAGQTIVAQVAPPARDRRCPFSAWLELERRPEPPKIHRFENDICILGSAPDSDFVLAQASCPPRAVAIVRGWQGFSVLAFAPGTRLNGSPLTGRIRLSARDELMFGTQICRFFIADSEPSP
jgi:pSer/pThr/pTyr-binding forkhead associated (FHA) protein